MENARYFQYIAGERKGEVVVFDHIENDEETEFVVFKDDSRCNEELITPVNDSNWKGKYMAEVENAQNIWTFKDEWVGRVEERTELNAEQERVVVEPFQPGRKKTTPVPPRKSTSNFGSITKHIEAAPPPVPADPVALMVDKSRKFDTEISLDMTVSLPKQSFYAVVDESFENGGTKMIDYIIDSMDAEAFKNALKDALIRAYSDTKVGGIKATTEESVNKDGQDVGSPMFKHEIISSSTAGVPTEETTS